MSSPFVGRFVTVSCTKIGIKFVNLRAKNKNSKLQNYPQNGYGLDDIHKFQFYYARFNAVLIIYFFAKFGKGSDPLYDGSKLVQETAGRIEYVWYILYYEQLRHFQPILNLVGMWKSWILCEMPQSLLYNRKS